MSAEHEVADYIQIDSVAGNYSTPATNLIEGNHESLDLLCDNNSNNELLNDVDGYLYDSNNKSDDVNKDSVYNLLPLILDDEKVTDDSICSIGSIERDHQLKTERSLFISSGSSSPSERINDSTLSNDINSISTTSPISISDITVAGDNAVLNYSGINNNNSNNNNDSNYNSNNTSGDNLRSFSNTQWDLMYRLSPSNHSDVHHNADDGNSDSGKQFKFENIDVSFPDELRCSNVILSEIISRLSSLNEVIKSDKRYSNQYKKREKLALIYALSNALRGKTNSGENSLSSSETSNNYSLPTVEEFVIFCKLVHNFLAVEDVSVRPIILRILRLCLISDDHCSILVETELHYLIIASLERDDVSERTQALKILKRFLNFPGTNFPIGFARSLVAIGNDSKDTCRKVCVETIRELTLIQLKTVVSVNGIQTLLNYVLDSSSSSDLSESIVLTMLHLLNDTDSRCYFRPYSDLRYLLSPFTDFDSASDSFNSDDQHTEKLKAAKNALLIMMKSFIGIVHLTSDEMALPTLIRMLGDVTISATLHNVILDVIDILLESLKCKNSIHSSFAAERNIGYYLNYEKLLNDLCNFDDSVSDVDTRNNSFTSASSNFQSNSNINATKGVTDFSVDNNSSGKQNVRRVSIGNTVGVSEQTKNTSSSIFGVFGITRTLNNIASFGSPAYKKRNSATSVSSTNINVSNETKEQSIESKSSVTSGKGNSGFPSFFGVGKNYSNSGSINSTKGLNTIAVTKTTSGPGTLTPSTSTSSVSSLSSNGNNNITSMVVNDTDFLPPLEPNIDSKNNDTDGGIYDILYAGEKDSDLIHNLFDNYAAILSCSLMHCNLLESLCSLGTLSTDSTVSNKSRVVLIEFLQIASRIFPEKNCVEILTNHALVDYASALSIDSISSSKSTKASQILHQLANSFSIAQQYSKQQQQVSVTNNSKSIAYPSAVSNANHSMVSTSLSASGRTFIDRGSMNSMIPNIPRTSTTPHIPAYVANTTSSSITSTSITETATMVQNIIDLSDEVISLSSFNSLAYPAENNRFGTANTWKTMRDPKTFSTICSPYYLSQGVNKIEYMNHLIISLRKDPVERNDFINLMEQTKILGKEGKDPLKWDWDLIYDIIKNSFQHEDRVNDAKSSKFLKRFMAFYRCSLDDKDKDRLIHMDWEIGNLKYATCLNNMCEVLANSSKGFECLKNDTDINFTLLNDITVELESLIHAYTKNSKAVYNSQAPMSSPFQRNSTNSAINKNLFRPVSVTTTLAREFFTFLGRLAGTKRGGELIGKDKNLFPVLTGLGARYDSLDYLCRIVLNSFIFTDSGVFSLHLIKIWSGDCTYGLSVYINSLLRIQLRSRPVDFNKWGIECLIQQLENVEENYFINIILPILLEASETKTFLKTIIRCKSKHLLRFIRHNDARQLFIRMLSVEEGVRYLSDSSDSFSTESNHSTFSSLKDILVNYKAVGFKDYTIDVEKKMARCLNTQFMQKYQSSLPTKVFSSKVNIYGNPITSVLKPIVIDSAESIFNTTQDILNSEFTNNGINLEGLVRLPWNIEIILKSNTDYKSSSGLNAKKNVDNFAVDTYLDSSNLSSPITALVTTDRSRIVTIRGIIVDHQNIPTSVQVNPNYIIDTCLLVGVNPVHRNGLIKGLFSSTDCRSPRKVNVNLYTSGNSSINNNNMYRPNRSNNTMNLETVEHPVTYQSESYHDWTHCKPADRQIHVIELSSNLFAVDMPNEPVRLIFSRVSPAHDRSNQTNYQDVKANSANSSADTTKRRSGSFHRNDIDIHMDANIVNRNNLKINGPVYLVEVQYFLRIETGMGTFVPFPRHLFGELARNTAGISLLKNERIVEDMVEIAMDEEGKSPRERRGALWVLGHIGSSDKGFECLHSVEEFSVEWLITQAVSAPNYSIRGTCFYVLGLISRSRNGYLKLKSLNWDSAPLGGRAAVSIPKNLKALFANHSHKDEKIKNKGPSTLVHPTEANLLNPFLPTGISTVELEILNCIARLPGLPHLHNQSKARLEVLKLEHPELFNARHLFVVVMKFMETYSLSLQIRKDVYRLFSIKAKCK